MPVSLVDTDPVFTQIGGFGLGGPFSQYHVLFTYGENIHRPGWRCRRVGHAGCQRASRWCWICGW